MIFAHLSGLAASMTVAIAAILPLPFSAVAQTPDVSEPATDAQGSEAEPGDEGLQPLSPNTQGLLSLEGGQNLMTEANQAIEAGDYTLAIRRLKTARQVFNQLSNFYQDLAGIFAGLDNRIALSHRANARNTAQLRDQATFQLALVHKAQRETSLAIPLLIQVIRSQNPTRDLGQRAFSQLPSGLLPPATQPIDGSETADNPQVAQPVAIEGVETVQPIEAEDPGILSVPGGEKLMAEAEQAVSAQNYPLAIQRLKEARQVFNQLSNFQQQLARIFTGVDNDKAGFYRTSALDTAQMRDQATYQLALVHRAERKPELSVPLLVQVVRSQQPTRDLGKKAYQQLFELGFVDTPYPLPRGTGQSVSSR